MKVSFMVLAAAVTLMPIVAKAEPPVPRQFAGLLVPKTAPNMTPIVKAALYYGGCGQKCDDARGMCPSNSRPEFDNSNGRCTARGCVGESISGQRC
jgi:hypothetical protein